MLHWDTGDEEGSVPGCDNKGQQTFVRPEEGGDYVEDPKSALMVTTKIRCYQSGLIDKAQLGYSGEDSCIARCSKKGKGKIRMALDSSQDVPGRVAVIDSSEKE